MNAPGDHKSARTVPRAARQTADALAEDFGVKQTGGRNPGGRSAIEVHGRRHRRVKFGLRICGGLNQSMRAGPEQ